MLRDLRPARGQLWLLVDDRAEIVHFVVDEATHRGFFRSAIEGKKLDVSAVAELTPHAYPDTYFDEHVWRDVTRFDGGYERVRVSLLSFLAVFDDAAHWIFTDETGRLSPRDSANPGHRGVTRELIERRFRAHGSRVAPEAPEVGTDRKCRKARERSVDGRTIYCKWHWKIEPHTNRVHVHEPIAESGDRAIVGIFAQHLPLPRD